MTEGRRHAQVIAELQSINHSVAQIVTIGDNLDTIIELVKPALRRAHESDRDPESIPDATTVPPPPALFADEHNDYARLHNGLGADSDYVLMPLRDQSNRVISGFPRTLGHLATHRDPVLCTNMLAAFDITPIPLGEYRQYCEFVGVNFGIAIHIGATYLPSLPGTKDELSERRESLREFTVSFAAPPTRSSQSSIQRLNTHARAENRISRFTLHPLRDIWGLVVPSFPKDLFELFNPSCVADVAFLLREYGQSDATEGCERRWVEFVGVLWEGRSDWLVDRFE